MTLRCLIDHYQGLSSYKFLLLQPQSKNGVKKKIGRFCFET